MEDIAIRVENLSKKYRIGGKIQTYRTLRDRLNDIVASRVESARSLFSRQPRPHRPGQSETFWALRDVSFEIQRGEVVGIIGKNGSGKSTLLKILSRITEPTEGLAQIRGRVGSLLEVGTGFHQELSGRENIYLNGAILGMTRQEIDRKFDEMVDFAEVEEFIDTPVKRYSSGMYLRLAFAVAAHLEPEILLVDEVLAVGDAAFQKKCLGKMSDAAQAGRTVLFVSHNLSAIASLTNRSIWLNEGRLISDDDTNKIIADYLGEVDNTADQSGFVDLTQNATQQKTTNPVQFRWIQSLDAGNNQRAIFEEGEPITIRLGFTLREPVRTLQFGCSVNFIPIGRTLFTVPSEEFDSSELSPGDYETDFTITPNFMRRGAYSLSIKHLVNGARQQNLPECFFVTIAKASGGVGDPYIQSWVAGPLKFDYTFTDPRMKTEAAQPNQEPISPS